MHPLRKLRESGPHTAAQVEPLLAENVVFHSPIFVLAIEGRERVAKVLAASTGVRAGRYTAELKLDARTTFLRWTGLVDGHPIEGLEIIEDDETGRIVDRTVPFRPLPAVQLFRDAVYPLLKDELPREYWECTDRYLATRRLRVAARSRG